MSERAERIARDWDRAAVGYDAYFVPRFAPWVRTAVDALAAAPLPDGPIVVPCCGTFPELDGLLAHFPDHDVVGVDLSAEMVRLARQRAGARSNVTVVQGDAAALDPATYAAVVSVFGLQQLPDPVAALHGWATALRPGGRLSVVYWPGVVEDEGPFALMRDGSSADGTSDWEQRLAPALTATGARVERDELPAFDMSHADAETFFDAFANSGPLSARDNLAELRADFLRRAPAGELRHRPRARHLVATASR